ncbi:MAG: hypothetical protein NC048_02670 [Bacteroides sp.]|nr:hypothetical protein [Bacteroides sp.]MCM1531457.1 hypothetical protein [Ruminococcus flavefaciens]MCM1554381.1 hypothetical protein [Bacteroides sp.]
MGFLNDFVDSCAAHIDKFLDVILSTVDNISGMVGGICGLAAFMYIFSKVWKNYSRGESIEIYPLLRPFVVGLLCANFNTVVVGGIRGLADPVCEYFYKMEEASSVSDPNSTFAKEMQKAESKVAQIQAKYKGKEDDNTSIWDGIGKIIKSVFNNLRNWFVIGLAKLFGFIADLLAALTKFVLIFTRCFSLSVLCLLGPIIFAISIFPGYKQGISQWISRFVCIYMWIPLFCLCNIFINTATETIAISLLDSFNSTVDALEMAYDSGTAEVKASKLNSLVLQLERLSANVALIGGLLSILTAVLYKSVPTLASWIIAGGDSSGQLASVAGFATNLAGIAGMGATLIGGAAFKGGRSAMGGVGKGVAKMGSKIAGKTPGTSDSGNITSMGAGPMDAPPRTPVGFQPSAAANTAVAAPPPATGLRMRDGGETATPTVSENDLSGVSRFRKVTGSTLEWVGKQMRRPKLNHIMKYGNDRQRYNVAKDPYATKSILKKAVKDPNIFVQQAALKSSNLSPKLLKRAMKYGYEETSTKAAHMLLEKQGGKMTPDIQKVFNANIATSNRPGGKSAVPATEGVPEPQPIGFSRSAPAPATSQTEGASVSKFRKITGNTMIWVGKQMRRPKLNHIMKYGNAQQRYNAAKDPYITRGVLKKAIVDPDKAVQMSALSNAKVTQKLLKRAAKYGYDETSTEALRMLNEMNKTKKGVKTDGNQ